MSLRVPTLTKAQIVLSRATRETPFQNDIFGRIDTLGLKAFHIPDSRRAPGEGYPDLTIAGPGGQAFWELKTETGRVNAAQREWLMTLLAGGARVAVLRPTDWHTGLIERELCELAGRRPARQVPPEVRAQEQLLLRLRTVRQARGWSRTELARRAGMSRQTVEDIETGRLASEAGVARIIEELGTHALGR